MEENGVWGGLLSLLQPSLSPCELPVVGTERALASSSWVSPALVNAHR